MPFATIQDLGPSKTTSVPNIPVGEVITGFIASWPVSYSVVSIPYVPSGMHGIFSGLYVIVLQLLNFI
jgi:hypothetical protein